MYSHTWLERAAEANPNESAELFPPEKVDIYVVRGSDRRESQWLKSERADGRTLTHDGEIHRMTDGWCRGDLTFVNTRVPFLGISYLKRQSDPTLINLFGRSRRDRGRKDGNSKP